MFNGIRQRIRRLTGRAPIIAHARDSTFQLRIPNPYGGAPWLTATVALNSTPHGRGEMLRFRAHFDGRVTLPRSGVEGRLLGLDSAGPRGLIRYSRDTAAAITRRVIRQLPAERLEAIGARRWRSWIDVQISTVPLDGGARSMTPEALREVYGDSLPQAGVGEPRVGVWTGPAGGSAGGVASLALLQFDERDLGRVPRDGSGFSVNASVAQVVEPNQPADDHDS